MKSTRDLFRENLKRLLKKKKVTQKKIAEEVGIVPQAMNKYVCGHRSPGLDLLTKIANALKVPPEELISENKLTLKGSLTKEDLHDLYYKALDKIHRIGIFDGLNIATEKELFEEIKKFGGWDLLYQHIREINLKKEAEEERIKNLGKFILPRSSVGLNDTNLESSSFDFISND